MIKYMILSLAVFSAALLLTGCSAEADGAYKKISASEAKEMMDKGNVTIVDVREPSGVRSLKASRELVSMGYKHVNDFGGILDWPYEIEK